MDLGRWLHVTKAGFLKLAIINSSHPKTALLTDIFVMLKILSSEYQLYACGKIFRMP
jgi:hypothetical protein